MIIIVYHDTICPWCRIGKRNLQQAINQWEGEEITVIYKPFFLNPATPQEGIDFKGYMAAKGAQNISYDEFVKPIIKMGKAVGINFNFDALKKIPNTLLSHQLLALTEDEHREKLLDGIYTGFFDNGKDIGNIDILLDIAHEIGLNREQLKEKINQKVVKNRVLSDVNFGLSIGIRGVPFFIINDKIGIYGAHPPDTLIKGMTKALEITSDATK